MAGGGWGHGSSKEEGPCGRVGDRTRLGRSLFTQTRLQTRGDLKGPLPSRAGVGVRRVEESHQVSSGVGCWGGWGGVWTDKGSVEAGGPRIDG